MLYSLSLTSLSMTRYGSLGGTCFQNSALGQEQEILENLLKRWLLFTALIWPNTLRKISMLKERSTLKENINVYLYFHTVSIVKKHHYEHQEK